MRHADGAPCCHAGELSPSVCGDGWFNLCTLIAQCATGVQPHPAPESNQSDSGQVRLLKPAINHTHSHNMFLYKCILFSNWKMFVNMKYTHFRKGLFKGM
ncbi:unnamed protein product [Lota lota]